MVVLLIMERLRHRNPTEQTINAHALFALWADRIRSSNLILALHLRIFSRSVPISRPFFSHVDVPDFSCMTPLYHNITSPTTACIWFFLSFFVFKQIMLCLKFGQKISYKYLNSLLFRYWSPQLTFSIHSILNLMDNWP